jgi:hypothetical protein
MNLTRLICLIVSLLCLSVVAHAASVTIPASKDNTIFQSHVNNSAGGAAAIFAGTNNVGPPTSPRRGLIAFDIAGNVPAGATITSVGLTMDLANAPNTTNQTIGLHRLTADWGEGMAGSSTPGVGGIGNGFPAGAGDATWNNRVHQPSPPPPSTPWSSPGAAGDFTPLASASAVVGGSVDTPHVWSSTPALVGDIQNWLDSPGTNFGWALVNASESVIQTFKGFYSRESTQNSGGYRPALTITYIPEPTTAMLLVLAGPLVLLIRHR